jgi:hypothetical protein
MEGNDSLMNPVDPLTSNSHLGMKGRVSRGFGMKLKTALKPLYSMVPSDTNLSQRERPELVMIGGKSDPQNLPISVE